MSTKSRHWVTEPKLRFDCISAYGMSTWDMPDGGRLRRTMQRSTALCSLKTMKKWAKKYGLNVDRESTAWRELQSLDAGKKFS